VLSLGVGGPTGVRVDAPDTVRACHCLAKARMAKQMMAKRMGALRDTHTDQDLRRFDWVDEQHSAIRLSIECDHYRENRGFCLFSAISRTFVQAIFSVVAATLAAIRDG
jgi:hypothetical protein